jgi:serine/threonine protein kinase/tetratricopeptide (TPR) repeat protein
MAEPLDLIFPKLPTRYRLLGRLGSGGGGSVFRAFDRSLSTDIAIKLSSRAFARDLLNEFEAFRQIRHANLVRVHDWIPTSDGQAVYSMELMAGGDWGSFMTRPQSSETVLSILVMLMRGLAHLHCHSQIHGDLKPGNVLFGLSGEVKLSDVGMGSLGRDALGSGTPGYAAPEVWEGTTGDFRSDIYSASVMAYEALTGRHPFEGKTIREVVAGQLEGWVPSPEVHGVRADPGLVRTVMRGLERDPQLRQGTADEFLESLGVDDRVGEILGGKFVNRQHELGALSDVLSSPMPGSPTLVYIVGQGGSGRRALVHEFAHKAALVGVEIAQKLPEGSDVSAAEEILGRDSPTKQLLIPESEALTEPSELERIRTFARYLYSLSVEREIPCPALIVCCLERHPSILDEFETTIRIEPFTSEQVRDCIGGYLGEVRLEHEVFQWLEDASGGVPGHLLSLVSSLIERGLLRRRAGAWSFMEGEQLRGLDSTLVDNPWDAAWRHLGLSQQRVLAVLAGFPDGLASKALDAALPDLCRTLPELAVRGWVRLMDSRWRLSSLEIKRTAQANAEQQHLGSDRASLETKGCEYLSREEGSLLRLSNHTDPGAFDEGMWAARAALKRGDHKLALELVGRCLLIAKELSDTHRIEDALLLLATARHQRGEWADALALLDNADVNQRVAEREFLRGIIEKAMGNTEGSRKSLANAVECSEREEDLRTLLVSQSELAELDWRHGDEHARLAAIDRVSRVLGREYSPGSFIEERAGLSYQLGAALIVAGRRDEAKQVLNAGMELSPGDYWSMRLANALGTAEYYLGHFDEALRLMGDAWTKAERGGYDAFKARIMSNRAGIAYAVGGFKQAVDYHETASLWARRTGSRFEFIAACQGAAVNQMLLSDYEGAIAHVQHGGVVAKEIKSEYHIAKTIDLEALVEFYAGSWKRSKGLVDRAAEEDARIGQSDVSPRIDLLRGRLARVEGKGPEAERFLRSAERALTETQDWEDLPGVQIELELLRAESHPHEAMSRILEIAATTNALTVRLAAGVAIGEIVVNRVVDDGESWDYLASILGRADEAGAMEAVWRINLALGEIAFRRGDRKGAATRFAQSLRGFRQVADKLSAERRGFYLDTPHARHLLARVS